MDFSPFKNKNEAIVSLFHYTQQSLMELLSIHTKPKWLPPSVQDVPNPVKIKHISASLISKGELSTPFPLALQTFALPH